MGLEPAMPDRISLSGNFMEVVPAFARWPIKARNSRWAAASATLLVRQGVTPNAISCASIGCAGVAGVAFVVLRFVGTANRAGGAVYRCDRRHPGTPAMQPA